MASRRPTHGGLRGPPYRVNPVLQPTKERREAFAAEMQAATGVPITPVESPQDAVRRADIVMCATNAVDSVFFKPWVEPDMHPDGHQARQRDLRQHAA